MESNNGSTGNLLLALLGGAVLGAGIALLYAPQSGRRTRAKLRELGEDAEDYADELVAKVKERVACAEHKGEEWVRKGRECCEEHRRQDAAEAAKSAQ